MRIRDSNEEETHITWAYIFAFLLSLPKRELAVRPFFYQREGERDREGEREGEREREREREYSMKIKTDRSVTSFQKLLIVNITIKFSIPKDTA